MKNSPSLSWYKRKGKREIGRERKREGERAN